MLKHPVSWKMSIQRASIVLIRRLAASLALEIRGCPRKIYSININLFQRILCCFNCFFITSIMFCSYSISLSNLAIFSLASSPSMLWAVLLVSSPTFSWDEQLAYCSSSLSSGMAGQGKRLLFLALKIGLLSFLMTCMIWHSGWGQGAARTLWKRHMSNIYYLKSMISPFHLLMIK